MFVYTSLISVVCFISIDVVKGFFSLIQEVYGERSYTLHTTLQIGKCPKTFFIMYIERILYFP